MGTMSNAGNHFVSKSITAENQWTNPIRIGPKGGTLTVWGTFTAGVILQTRPDGATEWVPTADDTITIPCHKRLDDATRSEYRAGVPTGGFTLGPVNVMLKSS